MQPMPPERTGAFPQVEESQPKRPRRAFWQGKIGLALRLVECRNIPPNRGK